MADTTSLLSAEEMSEKLKGTLSASRLLELANAGLLPHYDVDGSVLFGAGETKEWLNHNLVVRRPGRHIGDSLVTVVEVTAPAKDHGSIPCELAAIAGALIPLSVQSSESVPIPGVYFLCHNKKVVYVGQSAKLPGRVGAHVGDKTFDTVWFIRIPKSDLDYVEGELIRTLRPKYNFDKKGGLVAPNSHGESWSHDSIQCVSAVRRSFMEDEHDGR